MRKPILVVTSERWGSQTYVIFDDEEIIGDIVSIDWIRDRYDYEREENPDITIEDVEKMMEDEFFEDNSGIDEHYTEQKIVRADDGYYYQYDNDGICSYLDEDDALEILQPAPHMPTGTLCRVKGA